MHVFCSIYLNVISDLRKTHSLHITKRKSLLIDICDRSTHPKTLTTSYEGSLSESSVAVQMQVLRKTLTTSYQESISERSVAVQMQGGCKPHLDSKLSADAHSSLNIAHWTQWCRFFTSRLLMEVSKGYVLTEDLSHCQNEMLWSAPLPLL